MKKIFIALLGAGLVVSCNETPEKVEEVVMEVVDSENEFGPEKVDESKAISTSDMIAAYEGQTEPKEFTFNAKIEEVCSKAGCWINVDKGNGEMFMVRFKDHFTIPTDTKIGSEAVLHGMAYWDTVSVDMLRHFAEDAGKSEEEIAKITEEKYELGFEADGILLK